MSTEHDPLDTRQQDQAKADEANVNRIRQQRRSDEFKWLMDQRQGRSFVWWLLGETGVFRNPFGAGNDVTNFRCGEMNVGQKLMAKVHELTPEKYQIMVKEQG